MLLLFLFSTLIGCRGGGEGGVAARQLTQGRPSVAGLGQALTLEKNVFCVLLQSPNSPDPDFSLSEVFSPMKRVIEQEVRFYNRGFKM